MRRLSLPLVAAAPVLASATRLDDPLEFCADAAFRAAVAERGRTHRRRRRVAGLAACVAAVGGAVVAGIPALGR